MPSLTTALREIVLQLALLIVTLAAVELLLRLADLRELREGYRQGSYLAYRYDAELGWSSVPNAVGTFTGSRTIHVQNNSLGMRDIEHKGPRRPTVLFLGDSFVWGYDVEANERFTELLRTELPGLNIVNAGVSGYGTDQEYLFLNRIWSTFQPDVVVLIFCVMNDRIDNSLNMTDGGHYKPYLARDIDGNFHFAGQPVPKSRYTYFAENRLVKNLWLARAAVTGYVHWRYPEISVPDPTERLVMMMKELVESRGAKFLVGVQYHDQQLEAYLQAQKIRYTSFEGADSYERDGSHWTPKGHVLVAKRLKDLLFETGAIKVAEPSP